VNVKIKHSQRNFFNSTKRTFLA